MEEIWAEGGQGKPKSKVKSSKLNFLKHVCLGESNTLKTKRIVFSLEVVDVEWENPTLS